MFCLLLLSTSVSIIVIVSAVDLEEEGRLIATSLIWRHGDRAPIRPYPGDAYDISYWSEGWEQLTYLGKQQHYALGQWFRKRYKNFLSCFFNVSDVYVKSSDVDRTLMSAEANLAGLYPPKGKQIWNKNLLWQPIPVHTVPKNLDYITGSSLPSCPSFENALKIYKEANMEEFYKSVLPVFENLTETIGVVIDDVNTLTLIYDTLLVESIHNLTLPTWSESIFPNYDDFNKVVLRLFYLESSTNFLAKFRSGYLLKDILDRFTAKIEETLIPDFKYYAYSTHDTVISNFLNSLGVFDFEFVPYAATIIMELREYKNEYYVQMFYKNSDKEPRPIHIPRCGTACPLSKWYEVYNDILPKFDFKIECSIGT